MPIATDEIQVLIDKTEQLLAETDSNQLTQELQALEKESAEPGFWDKPEAKSKIDRKSTRLNSSHSQQSRMPSSA